MRIYLSSTFEDLEAYRNEAIKAIRGLGHDHCSMEDYRAARDIPVEKCLRDVASCDYYVGIFAWRYGFVPLGYDKSITELEYREAIERRIPTLCFLLSDKFQWPDEYREEDPRLKALRDEISQSHMTCSFTTPENLRSLVAESLGNQLQVHKLQGKPIVGLRPADVSATFRDREHEYDKLTELLCDPTVKLICIVGRGGMGKTALVSKVCEQIESGELKLTDAATEMGADGIVYVSFKDKPMPSEGHILTRIGQMLGEDKEKRVLDIMKDSTVSLAERSRLILSLLGKGCYLLVLDNLEDILASDNTIADEGLRTFLEVCLSTPHNMQLIATSREEVRVQEGGSQTARRLFPLDEGLPEDEAVELLRSLDPDNLLGIRDAPAELLEKAVIACSSIPRAFEIMTGMLEDDTELTLGELLLDKKLFGEGVVEKLAADFYRRVSDAEKVVLEALSVYKRPVPTSAVEFLLEPFHPKLDVKGCLHSLVKKRFVTARRSEKTYELHSIDQMHAYAQIPETGAYSRRSLHARAAEYSRILRTTYEEHWKDRDALLWWYRYEDFKWQTLVEAWLYHLARTHDKSTARLAFTTIFFDAFFWWGEFVESPFCDLLMEMWDRTQTLSEDRKLLQYFLQFYTTYRPGFDDKQEIDWAKVKDALLALRQLLNIDEKLGMLDESQRQLVTITDVYLGAACCGLSSYIEAEQYYRKAYDLFDDDCNRAKVLYDICNLYVQRTRQSSDTGHSEESERSARVALQVANESEELALRPGRNKTLEETIKVQDYFLLSKVQVARARIHWVSDDLERTINCYTLAILLALAFQVLPHVRPDKFTQLYYRYVVQETVDRVRELQDKGRTEEALLGCRQMIDFWKPCEGLPCISLSSGQIRTMLNKKRWSDIEETLFPREPREEELDEPVSTYSSYVSEVIAAKRDVFLEILAPQNRRRP